MLSERLSDGLKPSGSPRQISWEPPHQKQTLAAAAGHRWGERMEPREEPLLGQRDAGSARCSAGVRLGWPDAQPDSQLHPAGSHLALNFYLY